MLQVGPSAAIALQKPAAHLPSLLMAARVCVVVGVRPERFGADATGLSLHWLHLAETRTPSRTNNLYLKTLLFSEK